MHNHTSPHQTAFPAPADTPGATLGLTAREYLAGQAMIGLLAFPAGGADQYEPDQAAEAAVAFADALLARLGRP